MIISPTLFKRSAFSSSTTRIWFFAIAEGSRGRPAINRKRLFHLSDGTIKNEEYRWWKRDSLSGNFNEVQLINSLLRKNLFLRIQFSRSLNKIKLLPSISAKEKFLLQEANALETGWWCRNIWCGKASQTTIRRMRWGISARKKFFVFRWNENGDKWSENFCIHQFAVNRSDRKAIFHNFRIKVLSEYSIQPFQFPPNPRSRKTFHIQRESKVYLVAAFRFINKESNFYPRLNKGGRLSSPSFGLVLSAMVFAYARYCWSGEKWK